MLIYFHLDYTLCNMADIPKKSMTEGHIEQIASHDEHYDKHQVDFEHAQHLAASYVPGSPEEKALIRKLDWRLVPTTWLLYLLSNVDRTNIGNAKIGKSACCSHACNVADLSQVVWRRISTSRQISTR